MVTPEELFPRAILRIINFHKIKFQNIHCVMNCFEGLTKLITKDIFFKIPRIKTKFYFHISNMYDL